MKEDDYPIKKGNNKRKYSLPQGSHISWNVMKSGSWKQKLLIGLFYLVIIAAVAIPLFFVGERKGKEYYDNTEAAGPQDSSGSYPLSFLDSRERDKIFESPVGMAFLAAIIEPAIFLGRVIIGMIRGVDQKFFKGDFSSYFLSTVHHSKVKPGDIELSETSPVLQNATGSTASKLFNLLKLPRYWAWTKMVGTMLMNSAVNGLIAITPALVAQLVTVGTMFLSSEEADKYSGASSTGIDYHYNQDFVIGWTIALAAATIAIRTGMSIVAINEDTDTFVTLKDGEISSKSASWNPFRTTPHQN